MNRHAASKKREAIPTGPHGGSRSRKGYVLFVAREKEQKITRKRGAHATNLLGFALAVAVLLTAFLYLTLLLQYEHPIIKEEGANSLVWGGSTPRARANKIANKFSTMSVETSSSSIAADELPAAQSTAANNSRSETQLYWNLSCPFESFTLSQSYMATSGHNNTKEEQIYGLERAEAARQFSIESRALEKVHAALQSGAFAGRRIVFDGDSLTRQLFISLGCLAWGSGYVTSHQTEWREFTDEQATALRQHFPRFIHKGEHSAILGSYVQLQGGTELIFEDRHRKSDKTMYRGNKQVQKLIDWTLACQENRTILQGGKRLTNKDVVVINAGVHPDRNKQVDHIKKLLECVSGKQQRAGGHHMLPRFIYMMTSLQHFWTKKGTFDARFMNEKEFTCRRKTEDCQRQCGDKVNFGPLAPLLGEVPDQSDLGHLKVWRGDCTHWIMPGVTDAWAGELATYLQRPKSRTKN
jgi:hypothetical protein